MCIFESKSETRCNICTVVGRDETFWKKFASMTFNFWLKRQYFTNKIFKNKGNMKESRMLTNSLLSKPSKSTNISAIKDGNTGIREVNFQYIEQSFLFCWPGVG